MLMKFTKIIINEPTKEDFRKKEVKFPASKANTFNSLLNTDWREDDLVDLIVSATTNHLDDVQRERERESE